MIWPRRRSAMNSRSISDVLVGGGLLRRGQHARRALAQPQERQCHRRRPATRPARRPRRPARTPRSARTAGPASGDGRKLAGTAPRRGQRVLGAEVVGERERQPEHARPAARCSRWTRAATPAAGCRRRAWRGSVLRRSRRRSSPSAHQLLREVVGGQRSRPSGAARAPCAGRCRARGRCPGRSGPGGGASSMPNCSATTSGGWLGSITPPEPTRIVDVAAATCADQHGGRGTGDARHVVVLGQPEPRVARGLRCVWPVRACCAGPARWSNRRPPETRSSTDSGTGVS